MEISFNILYLVTIYALIILMLVRRKNVEKNHLKQANRILIAFILLALGDTGHVGFRVIAYALGGFESNALLVGLGALSTAITVGIFYMLILDLWRIQFNKSFNACYIILLIAGIVRLGLFFFPQNQWGSVVPPADWGLYRNVPLMIQGIGIATLLLIDSYKTKNKIYRNIAIWIFVSYAFYLPVIFFVRIVPMIGMLMIPKTIAYVVIAIIGYKAYFSKKSQNIH